MNFIDLTEGRDALRRKDGIYFITHQNTSLVKIGRATNLLSRLTTYLTALKGIRVLAAIEVDSRSLKWAEKQIHQQFAGARHEGEWFYMSNELAAYIEQAPGPAFDLERAPKPVKKEKVKKEKEAPRTGNRKKPYRARKKLAEMMERLSDDQLKSLKDVIMSQTFIASDTEKALVKEFHSLGFSHRQLVKLFNRERQAIQRWLHEVSNSKGLRTRYPIEFKLQLAEEIKNSSQADVCRKYGIHSSAISRWSRLEVPAVRP